MLGFYIHVGIAAHCGIAIFRKYFDRWSFKDYKGWKNILKGIAITVACIALWPVNLALCIYEEIRSYR